MFHRKQPGKCLLAGKYNPISMKYFTRNNTKATETKALFYNDLRPGQTCHSIVMHRKEVTHSDGSYEKESRRRAWLKKWDMVKIPWYTHRLMHRKRVTCELHDSYFRLMTIKRASPETPEVAYSGLASHENRY